MFTFPSNIVAAAVLLIYFGLHTQLCFWPTTALRPTKLQRHNVAIVHLGGYLCAFIRIIATKYLTSAKQPRPPSNLSPTPFPPTPKTPAPSWTPRSFFFPIVRLKPITNIPRLSSLYPLLVTIRRITFVPEPLAGASAFNTGQTRRPLACVPFQWPLTHGRGPGGPGRTGEGE